MIDLNRIAKNSLKYAKNRTRNGGPGSDYLKHAAGEVVEAMEAKKDFEYYHALLKTCDITEMGGTIEKFEEAKKHFIEELADGIICLLLEAAENNFNAEWAIETKADINFMRSIGKGDKK